MNIINRQTSHICRPPMRNIGGGGVNSFLNRKLNNNIYLSISTFLLPQWSHMIAYIMFTNINSSSYFIDVV